MYQHPATRPKHNGGASMNDIVTLKKCGSCKNIKPISNFNKNRNRKDGLCFECKSCNSERHKKYDINNPGKLNQWGRNNPKKRNESVLRWAHSHKEYYKKYRDSHVEQSRESVRKSRIIHIESTRERERKYRLEHPEKSIEQNRRRRARILGCGGTIKEEEWKELKNKFGNICLCCKRNDVKLTLDHVIPLKLGGENIIENAQPLCQPCNSRKGIKVIDYR